MEHFDWVRGFVYPYINFGLYLAIIFFLARPALKKMFAEKRAAFLRQQEDAQRAKLQAEEQAAILQQKLASLDQEINTILSNAKIAADSEAKAIISSAETLAQHIKTEAKRMAEAEVENARLQLQKTIVAEVSSAVSKRLGSEVNAEQHSKLVLKDVDFVKQARIGSLS